EYNNFVILPEYFSQGNGNYRDINQNRRSDVFFHPEVGDNLIKIFMNLIQLDGFNPLKLLGTYFKVENKKPVLDLFKENKSKVKKFIETTFSIGAFFNFIEEEDMGAGKDYKHILNTIIENSKKLNIANPGECYWSDHWHYNIDLIENYLAVYPEKKKELLFKLKDFVFYDNPEVVKPRDEKYFLIDKKARQLNAVKTDPRKIEMIARRREKPHAVRKRFGRGDIYKTTLICKLLCLVANKYASLDPMGIGVEMESDKPNWCDALNGLPGMFGSSTAESFELKRLILFLRDAILTLDEKEKISLPEELCDLMLELEKVTDCHENDYNFWNSSHNAKENYRENTAYGVSGCEKHLNISRLKSMLHKFLRRLEKGLSLAIDEEKGFVYTNFEYTPQKYNIIPEEEGKKQVHPRIRITEFKMKRLPLFLEGPVHYLRINRDKKQASDMHKKLLKSGLYDKKLKMFKVNESLEGVDYDIGRITVFTPGWLENESIWLHMEYKYMLELLRNGLYEEYYKLLDTALVPFMDPETYGRSIYENSSFIVSSAHPDKNIHGRGYVARLTGSSAEYLSMWVAMTSGFKPFITDAKGRLSLKFSPALPGNWFTKEKTPDCPENSFKFVFMGKTPVIYRNQKRKDTFGKKGAKIKEIHIQINENEKIKIEGDTIQMPYSKLVREGRAKKIEVKLD
ncbi:MAG: hypothetical protein ACQESB_03905, partial [Elusimicrobiota bacterium]